MYVVLGRARAPARNFEKAANLRRNRVGSQIGDLRRQARAEHWARIQVKPGDSVECEATQPAAQLLLESRVRHHSSLLPPSLDTSRYHLYTYNKMTFATLWYSHPRKFGKGSRQWYVFQQ